MSTKTDTKIAAAVAGVLLAVACATAPVLGNRSPVQGLADGVYEGEFTSFPNSARVAVTIAGGRIAKVEVLFHGGSWVGDKAVKGIPGRIVDKQSTQVDAVTGATNSSQVIMNATENALEKAGKAAAPPAQ